MAEKKPKIKIRKADTESDSRRTTMDDVRDVEEGVRRVLGGIVSLGAGAAKLITSGGDTKAALKTTRKWYKASKNMDPKRKVRKSKVTIKKK